MQSTIRSDWWLTLLCLVLLVGNLTAQAPMPIEPEIKLPTLMTGKPHKEEPKDDELRKLLKAHNNEALGEMKERYKRMYVGQGVLDDVYQSAQRFVQSGLELCEKPAERLDLLTQYVDFTKEIEENIKLRFAHRRVGVMDVHRASYMRLDAEIQLLRAKREADKVKGK